MFLLYGYIRPAFHEHSSWEEWAAVAASVAELERLAEPFGDYPGHSASDQLTGYDMVSLALGSVMAGASTEIVVPGACQYDPSGLGLDLRRRLRELGWVRTSG